jgi:uncharacterized membrane protein YeaQ/YmgE (transglycosylase-associated protein family)
MNPTPDTDTLGITAAAQRAQAGYVRRVFRLPRGPRLLSLFGVIILAMVTGIMAALAVLAFTLNWALGLFMTALAGFIGALVGYVWRDLRGKWNLRVVLDTDTVTLDLPTGRSLIHRPPAQHLTIAYTDIAAIDARYEAYGSLGMENMQRAYALHRKSGELIFLFEDRALATGMASSFFTDLVADLAARAHVAVHDIGTVEGKGGFLSVWGTHAPDWAAPGLPRAQAMRLWRHAATTGSLAMSTILLVVLVMYFFGTG